jgi:uncharacterized protein YciI
MNPSRRRFALSLLLLPGGPPLALTLGSELRAPAAKRSQFIGILRVTPQFHEPGAWTDKENLVVAKHFERLSKAVAKGDVIMAGRTSEALPQTFGLVVFEADNLAAATRFMQADPAVVAGLMTATVHPYFVALQRGPAHFLQ